MTSAVRWRRAASGDEPPVLQVAEMRACAAVLCLGVALSARAEEPPPSPGAHAAGPRLAARGGRTRLEVGGRAFFARGGELANSSAASLADLTVALAKLPRLGLNTVLVPVSWELIEPEEGSFDFALVGGAIREARRNRLHVVLLWFGSWKNGMSSYVPAWVKRDEKRFPRAEVAGGHGVEALSAFSTANRDADARAFAALLRFVRTLDAHTGTVVMVQVENEVAMIGEAARSQRRRNRRLPGAGAGRGGTRDGDQDPRPSCCRMISGNASSTRVRRRRSGSRPGRSPATSMRSRAPARRSTRCRCS